jgi:hypothetical protein
MTTYLAMGLLLVSTLLVGCESANSIAGSGATKSEKRDVPAFDAVVADGGFAIDITVGEATEVTVQADDNILPLIHTRVEHGSLVISSDRSYRSTHSINVTIKMPDLSGVTVNGSSDVKARGVNTDSLKLAINGSGSIVMAGAAKRLDAAINGSGDLKLSDLGTEIGHIAIAGSGDATVDVSESLQAAISGSGSVRYRPHERLKLSRQIIGSGSVSAM